MPFRPPLHSYHWHPLDKCMAECTGGSLARSSGHATDRPRDLGQADPDSSLSDSRPLDEPDLNSLAQADPQGQRSKSLQSSKPASRILPPVPEGTCRSEPEARVAFAPAQPPYQLPLSDPSAQESESTSVWMTTYPSRTMFNAKGLSELLAKHEKPELFPRLFAMSPNGTLLAYSTPVDIRELRDQAALVSMAWKEYQGLVEKRKRSQDLPQSSQSSASTIAPGSLETLTIEAEHYNILVRAIQPKMLLVMVGGIPPKMKRPFKMTPESPGEPRYPSAELPPSTETSAPSPGSNQPSSTSQDSVPEQGAAASPSQSAASRSPSELTERQKDIKLGTLHIQRKKLDALTKYIRRDFDSTGFVMPDI